MFVDWGYVQWFIWSAACAYAGATVDRIGHTDPSVFPIIGPWLMDATASYRNRPDA